MTEEKKQEFLQEVKFQHYSNGEEFEKNPEKFEDLKKRYPNFFKNTQID